MSHAPFFVSFLGSCVMVDVCREPLLGSAVANPRSLGKSKGEESPGREEREREKEENKKNQNQGQKLLEEEGGDEELLSS